MKERVLVRVMGMPREVNHTVAPDRPDPTRTRAESSAGRRSHRDAAGEVRRRWTTCLLLTCLGWCLACGGSGDHVPVTGTVTYDGKPLEKGNITFGGDQGAAGVGEIVNGAYSLSEAGDIPGVKPGKYSVLIQSWVEERGAVREDGSFSPGITRIPLKYLEPEKSGLQAEVTASGDNVFNFDLKPE